MQTGSQTKSFKVGSATFGDGRLTIIAGPCVIESEEHALMMARECAARARDAGLEILQDVKDKLNVPVLTDVHDVAQIEQVAAIVDVLQIPAFLCRQTDLITAAAQSGRAVNIKK